MLLDSQNIFFCVVFVKILYNKVDCNVYSVYTNIMSASAGSSKFFKCINITKINKQLQEYLLKTDSCLIFRAL